jgi:hypothetical protein
VCDETYVIYLECAGRVGIAYACVSAWSVSMEHDWSVKGSIPVGVPVVCRELPRSLKNLCGNSKALLWEIR